MDFYDFPPDYESLIHKLMDLKQNYPFLQLFEIGKTVLGRRIYAVGFGNLSYANLLAGAFHGQEWLTASVLTKFTEHLCRSLAKHKKTFGIDLHTTLTQKGIVIVPMVNPDGVEIALNGASSARHLKKQVQQMMERFPEKSWQANARGIDLNHNFDAGFSICKQLEQQSGITEAGPRQYGGEKPHSEPEVQSIVSLCKNFNIKCAFAFHSQGEEIFYHYGDHTPISSKYIASLLASYSGYQIVEQTGLASHGGFKDWFIEKQHRPGFTFEIGKGTNPLPIEDLMPVFQRLNETLVVAAFI